MEITTWTGCYDESWKGLITEDAFAHPAKFAPGLIKRILAHGLERGWWKRGDLIGDPFGGIAGGGIMAGYAGLNWVGVELEPRFHAMGLKNIQLHAPTWCACGDASFVKLVQGDSRHFAKIIGEAAAVLTSPPYSETLSHGGGPDTKHDILQGGKSLLAIKEGYGVTPGQIGGLPPGTVDGAITSPPYAGCRDDGCGIAIDGETTSNKLGQSSLAGVISSPPYADTAVEKNSTGIDLRKQWENYRKNGGGSSWEAYQRQQLKHSGGYGVSSGQIAALKSGELASVITSPPYAESIKGDHKEKETAAESHAARSDPGQGGSLGKSQRFGGYGAETGNIGNLKSGNVDAVVSSPPYAASNMKPHKLGTGKATRGPGDSAGRNKGDYHHPESPGQIGNLKEGTLSGVATSPPYEHSIESRGDGVDWEKTCATHRGSKTPGRRAITDGYGAAAGQIATERGETYWQAMHAVYSQCLIAMKPGGVMAVVVKNYVKDKKIVPLCDQTLRLLTALGFEPVERIHAMLVKHSTREGLFHTETKTTERKSFFRRLAEKKGSPRIDWEEVLVVRKPQ